GAEGKRPGVGVDPAAGIDDRVFVRIVGGAGSYKLGDEPAFPAKTSSRYYDGLSAPPNNAGMYEQSAPGPLGDVQLQIRFEAFEHIGDLPGASHFYYVGIQQADAANSGSRRPDCRAAGSWGGASRGPDCGAGWARGSCGNYRVQSIDHWRARRLPSRRQP